MAAVAKKITRKFLYVDENVKYSFDVDNQQVTINCDHPIFINHLKSSSATFNIGEFPKTSQKGSSDYDFFEKLQISLQEYFLDHGVGE
jgi:hypothetical protein